MVASSDGSFGVSREGDCLDTGEGSGLIDYSATAGFSRCSDACLF